MARILIVEDEEGIRANLKRFFQFEGHEVIETGNGLIAVEAAQTLAPDVIVCDVMLPGLDGFGILKTLRADPKLAGIPFFFLTATAEAERRKEGMALGATGYLVKPFSLVDLRVILALLK